MNDQEKVDWFFNERVLGWMCADIRRAIDAHVNYLAALALSVYTEVLGGFITGKLTSRRKGQSRENYTAFLKWLGGHYVKQSDFLYDKVRCGLVHEYFIKGPSAIVIKARAVDKFGRPVEAPGVVLQDNLIVFACENYFADFRKAILRYYSELKKGNHLKEFLTVFEELQRR